METTPEESPVTYKRRRSGRPLSELPWNASDVAIDPESAVSLLASDDEGLEYVTPAKKRPKRWSDQPLPRRQTRSSTASGNHSSTLKDRAVRAFGTLFGTKGKNQEKDKGEILENTPRKGKENVKGRRIERIPRKDTENDRGKGVDRTPTPRKHTAGTQATKESPLWHAPIEFVMEKKAFFEEVDKFQLECEEEEPEENKTTGKEMQSDSSGETISLETSKGETSVKLSNTGPEQSTQDVRNTEERSQGETSVLPPNTRPEPSTQEVTIAEGVSSGETAVQTPITMLEQNTEVAITMEVGEKNDG